MFIILHDIFLCECTLLNIASKIIKYLATTCEDIRAIFGNYPRNKCINLFFPFTNSKRYYWSHIINIKCQR